MLLVDDHGLFRDALESVLTATGSVDVVGRGSNGREAVELAAALEPDVIVIDIEMPLLDGLEATRRIRAEAGRGVKIFVLSGSEVPSDVARARAAGASGFFRKDAPLAAGTDQSQGDGAAAARQEPALLELR